MAKHNEFGKWGEQQAADFLQAKGFRILERNWKSFRHEVDIIALDGSTLVFVEVKSRAKNFLVEPERAVDWRKERSLCSAANTYLKYHRVNADVRFDIVTVVGSESEGAEISHITDAFVYPFR